MARALRPPQRGHVLRVDEWFQSESHPRSTVMVARQSHLPRQAAIVHQRTVAGTSMLQSGPDSLVGLTSGESASSSQRAPTALGERGLRRQRILEPDASGALQVPPIREPPEFQCILGFLRCSRRFSNEREWRAHVERHFQPAEPPPTAHCCFCGSELGWKDLLKHLNEAHFVLGHRMAHSRADFNLINYLRNKRVITEQEWKDLQGTEESRPATDHTAGTAAGPPWMRAGYGGATTPYTVTYDPREERRERERERAGRR